MTIKEIAKELNEYILSEEYLKGEFLSEEVLGVLRESYNILTQFNQLKLKNVEYCSNFYFYKEPQKKESETKENPIHFLYIIKGKKMYKVGRTRDLKSREQNIKSNNPSIKMIASLKTTLRDAMEKEKQIHSILNKYQLSGEWFETKTEDIMKLVKAYGFNLHLDNQGGQYEK
jgi:hypothetical protein